MFRGPNDPPRKPRDYRKTGIILCAIAVVLFAYSAFSQRWLEGTPGGDDWVGFSLISFEMCDGDNCKSVSNFALIRELARIKDSSLREREREKPTRTFPVAGVITMGLSLLSLLALGAAAVLAYKQLRYRIPPTTIALLGIMGTLIFGCMFVAKKPGGYGAVGVGPSFWAFAIACVVGIIGAQMLAKLVKPLDPDLPTHVEV